MSDSPAFPALKSKLAAPTKKSAFEKAKADAEAKRLREEAETAAVYQDFVKSFADDSDPDEYYGESQGRIGGGLSRGGGALRGKAGVGAGQRRHFTASGKGLPPPPTGPGGMGKFGRKRALDFDEEDQREREKRRLRDSGGSGLLAFENSGLGREGEKRDEYFSQQHSDDEEEQVKDQPKPTLQLRDLPPGFGAAEIRELFASVNKDLVVDSVRMLPSSVPSGPGAQGATRKASAAIVTLSIGTPGSEIDAATSTLQNRYLGCGFWLNISRHLPSTIIGQDSLSSLSSNANSSLPFGAKAHTGPINRMNRAPPPSGFAPPPQFGGRQAGPNFSGRLEVQVTAPKDLKLLKAIHKTIEGVLAYGPEFEGLLMSREDIQRDEKWAWLWDTRSSAHNYYIWRLWEILTGTSALSSTHSSLRHPIELFVGHNTSQLPVWVPPKKRLHYEFATSLGDIVDDPDYRSEDEFASDSEVEQGDVDKPAGGLGIGGGDDKRRNYLTPLDRAKLIHLIARIPTSTTKVRRGDVARVMAFALEHAWAAEEVVDVLVANIIRPFALQKSLDDDEAKDYTSEEEDEEKATQRADDKERDTSGAKIVGLYLISDVLSNSSLGIRNVWRYRTHVETKLRDAHVMEELGRVPEREGWGRMRKEKFKRLVSGVLGLWESWCIFPQTSHEALLTAFLDPPSDKPIPTAPPTTTATTSSTSTAANLPVPAPTKSKWRTVDTTAEPAAPSTYNPFAPPSTAALQVQQLSTQASNSFSQPSFHESNTTIASVDLDGAPMSEDEDDIIAEGENLDGEPMTDSSDEEGDGSSAPRPSSAMEVEKPEEVKKEEEKPKVGLGFGLGMGLGGFNMSLKKVGPAAGGRKRPRAEDMFAEDDD